MEPEEFQLLTLESKPIFDGHHALYPANHSENMFTALVSWAHYIKPYYLAKGENLVILTRPEGRMRPRPPSGPRNQGLLAEVLTMAKVHDADYLLVLVDNDQRDWIASLHPDLKFTKHRDYFDYVYLASDLVELRGKAYMKIRNRLNRFNRQYEYEVEPLCAQNLDEVREFLKRWCLWKDCESDMVLENERLAVIYTMEHCMELQLQGLALRINGEVEAVTVFEAMAPDMAVVHFEKAMPDFDGIYQAINNETAKLLAKDFTYINRQSDLGAPGLRTAKQRYHPHHMIEVQHVARERIPDLNVQGPEDELEVY